MNLCIHLLVYLLGSLGIIVYLKIENIFFFSPMYIISTYDVYKVILINLCNVQLFILYNLVN